MTHDTQLQIVPQPQPQTQTPRPSGAATKPEKQAQPSAGKNEPPKRWKIQSPVKILLDHLRADEELTGLENSPWQHAFLMALARAPIPIVAAKFAGVTRRRVFAERAADEAFSKSWDDAMEEGVDSLEAAAFLSAVFGDERPVFYAGKQNGTTVEHAPSVRTFLLKSLRPMTFDEPPAADARERTIHTYEDFEKRLEMARA